MSKFLKIYENTQHYIKTGIIIESEEEQREVTIQVGEELYHGTAEDFHKDDAAPGGYDSLFWVVYSKHYPKSGKNTALTYIPKHGSATYTTTQHLLTPVVNGPSREQKALGINYEVIEVNGSRVQSWRWLSPWILEIEKKEDELYHERDTKGTKFIETKKKHQEKLKKLKDKSNELVKELDNVPYGEYEKDENKKLFDEYNDVEISIAKMERDFRKLEKENEDNLTLNYAKRVELKREMNNVVNEKLKAMKYIPTEDSNKDGNYSWKLVHDRNMELADGDYSEAGRLLVLKPKRPLLIKDIRVGEEGDLTAVEYHNHKGFEQAKEEGYDGVLINDFAQHHKYGNVGHKSIGLFKSALKAVTIEEELDQKHPDEIMPHK